MCDDDAWIILSKSATKVPHYNARSKVEENTSKIHYILAPGQASALGSPPLAKKTRSPLPDLSLLYPM